MGKGGFGADRGFLRADRGGSAGDQPAGVGRIGASPLGVIPDPLPPSLGDEKEEERRRPSGIQATYTGPERVEYRGEVHSGPNAEGDLARALIGAGVDPGERLVISRNGTPAIQGTIAAFAGRAWAGVDADPLFRRWRPHPAGKYPPLLMAWDAQRPPPPSRGSERGGKARNGSDCAVRRENAYPAAPTETRAITDRNEAGHPALLSYRAAIERTGREAEVEVQDCLRERNVAAVTEAAQINPDVSRELGLRS